MPKLPPHLRRRGTSGVYYYRIVYPEELRPFLDNRVEFNQSLKTTDRKEAIRKHSNIEARVQARIRTAQIQLQQLQLPPAVPTVNLSDSDIDSIVLEWFSRARQEAYNEYLEAIGEGGVAPYNSIDDITGYLEILAQERDMKYVSEAPYHGIGESETDKILKNLKLNVPKDSPEYQKLNRLVIRGLIECNENKLKWHKSEYQWAKDVFFENAHQSAPSPTHREERQDRRSISVGQLIQQFLADKVGRKKRTLFQYNANFRLFTEFFGEDRPIHTISRADLVDFRDLLARSPANASKRFPEMTLRQIANSRHATKYASKSARTVNKALDNVSSLFNYAVTIGELDRNISTRLQLPNEEHDEDHESSFTCEQLEIIFHAPLYTGCQDDERGYNKPGDQVIRRHRFWVPLIALYSGMRLNEICQLHIHDLKEHSGIAYFDINRYGANGKITKFKSLKTDGAKRYVPVHPKLIEFGLLEYHRGLKRAGERRLFPLLTYKESVNSYSDAFSKWFNLFLENLGVKQGRRSMCFHSFRHTFADATRNAEIEVSIAEALGGWKGRTSQYNEYGDKKIIRPLFNNISRIEYDGLDLSHLEL